MTPTHEPDVPRTRPEIRAERLGFALRDLAADLVDERRKVAQLRHQVAELEAEIESLKRTRRAASADLSGGGFIHPG